MRGLGDSVNRLALAIGIGAIAVLSFLAGRFYDGAAPVTHASAHVRYRDPMHPAYTSDKPGVAPDCGMKLVAYDPDAPDGHSPASSGAPEVRVAAGALQALNVRLVEAAISAGVRRFRTVGKVTPDDALVYRVSTGSEGWIRSVAPFSVGSMVLRDQLLATFYSRDFIAAQQAYFYALASLDRETKAGGNAQQLALAQTQVQQTRETLEALGMGAHQLEEIAGPRQEAKAIELRSPATGVILARDAVVDQRFGKYMELYRIADLSRIWVIASLYESDARYIRSGQAARLSVPAAGRTLAARTVEVLPPEDGTGRVLNLRLAAENPDAALRPGMLVDVDLEVDLPASLMVPDDAVVDTGRARMVFVSRGEGAFEPRPVETGWRFDGKVQITSGLKAGERVALGANFLLDSDTRLRSGHD